MSAEIERQARALIEVIVEKRISARLEQYQASLTKINGGLIVLALATEALRWSAPIASYDKAAALNHSVLELQAKVSTLLQSLRQSDPVKPTQ